jgi:hypothetical protein
MEFCAKVAKPRTKGRSFGGQINGLVITKIIAA